MNNFQNIAPRPKQPTVPPKGRPNAWKVAPSLLSSFRYAAAGLQYAFQTQRNFRIHVAIAVFILSILTWLQAPPIEFALIITVIALVLALELLNTALEAVVDLAVGKTYHELAKIAKDCAAGAVLVAAIAAVAIAFVLILPQIWLKLSAV